MTRVVAAAVAGLAALAAGAAPSAGSGLQTRVTIRAQSSILDWSQVTTLSGSIDSNRAGEFVEIEAKACGANPPFFRAVTGGETVDGGRWDAGYNSSISSAVRAVWNGNVSAEISVRQRVGVSLHRESGGQLTVGVVGGAQFWHKRAQIQRRISGSWRMVRSVVLTETGADDPTGRRSTVWSRGEFRLSLPKSSVIRAVFPLSQARPCHAAGVSRPLRT